MWNLKPIAVGTVFSKLTVISTEAVTKKFAVVCLCECGSTKEIARSNLRSGGTTSCGCHSLARKKIRAVKHGMFGTPIYAIWAGMISRTTKPKDKYFSRYGGAGIGVSDDWKNFENFYRDTGDRPEGTSLDRKDNTKGYCKDNCRWATRVEQQNNQSCSLRADYKGIEITVADMVQISGLNKTTIYSRLQKLWTVEDTINTPLHAKPSQPLRGDTALKLLYPQTMQIS